VHAETLVSSEPTVFMVDDDEAVRESLRWLVESVGLRVRAYASALKFVDDYRDDAPGCLVLDVRLPGVSGIELQESLLARGIDIPVIFVTGYADVPTAVRALKAGAIDFIEKPFNNQVLLDHIQRCVASDTERRAQRVQQEAIVARYAMLTLRQRRVMDLVASGNSNKMIAKALGISLKTVEAHRARVMEKMKAGSLAELVKRAVTCERARSSESAPVSWTKQRGFLG